MRGSYRAPLIAFAFLAACGRQVHLIEIEATPTAITVTKAPAVIAVGDSLQVLVHDSAWTDVFSLTRQESPLVEASRALATGSGELKKLSSWFPEIVNDLKHETTLSGTPFKAELLQPFVHSDLVLGKLTQAMAPGGAKGAKAPTPAERALAKLKDATADVVRAADNENEAVHSINDAVAATRTFRSIEGPSGHPRYGTWFLSSADL